MCDARLPGPSALACTLPPGHEYGHVYRGDDFTDRVHHESPED